MIPNRIPEYIEKYGFNPFRYSLIVTTAINAATKGHNDTNHKYGDASYTIHLSHVVDVAHRFIHLVPKELRPIIIAACWLHDSIEDARLTYNDIIKIFTSVGVSHADATMIAEIVRAVTNYTRGRNRAERMPDYIYQEIAETVGARFVKLCDRIGNIEFGGKADMYKKEHGHFKAKLYHDDFKLMFDYIEVLLEL
jgi:(p)ppGpp synthase/HD superfamily hydrolase